MAKLYVQKAVRNFSAWMSFSRSGRLEWRYLGSAPDAVRLLDAAAYGGEPK